MGSNLETIFNLYFEKFMITPEEKMGKLIAERKQLKENMKAIENMNISDEAKKFSIAEVTKKLLDNYLEMFETVKQMD